MNTLVDQLNEAATTSHLHHEWDYTNATAFPPEIIKAIDDHDMLDASTVSSICVMITPDRRPDGLVGLSSINWSARTSTGSVSGWINFDNKAQTVEAFVADYNITHG